MDRAAIRAALLLLGFQTNGSPYKLERIDITKKHTVVFIQIYPWWVIGIASMSTLTRPRTFISATKAWHYIQTLIGDRHADIPSDHCTDP